MTNDIAINLNSIYHKLYKFYGPQGWWPLIDQKVLIPWIKSVM